MEWKGFFFPLYPTIVSKFIKSVDLKLGLENEFYFYRPFLNQGNIYSIVIKFFLQHKINFL